MQAWKEFHTESTEKGHGGRREVPALFSVPSVCNAFDVIGPNALCELCVKRS
jgi:hypothetical protein